MIAKLKSLVWAYRQFRRVRISCKRPVLDLVNFGNKSGVVLDVGANKGGFASTVLVQAPLMYVHCFEPNGKLYQRLRGLASEWGVLNGSPRCIVNHQGIGSGNSEMELIITGMDGASSFLPVANASCVGWPDVNFSEVHREQVAITRLDAYMNENSMTAVKLLKLDIQGFELEALKGCGERLRDIEHIICEVQFVPLYEGAPLWHEVVKYAADFGFRLVVMDGVCFGRGGEPLQADVLLMRT